MQAECTENSLRTAQAMRWRAARQEHGGSPMMGVNQRAMNIQKATVSATNPVLPPSLMPVADSAGKQSPVQAMQCGQPRGYATLPERAHLAAMRLRHRQCLAACIQTRK